VKRELTDEQRAVDAPSFYDVFRKLASRTDKSGYSSFSSSSRRIRLLHWKEKLFLGKPLSCTCL